MRRPSLWHAPIAETPILMWLSSLRYHVAPYPRGITMSNLFYNSDISAERGLHLLQPKLITLNRGELIIE